MTLGVWSGKVSEYGRRGRLVCALSLLILQPLSPLSVEGGRKKKKGFKFGVDRCSGRIRSCESQVAVPKVCVCVCVLLCCVANGVVQRYGYGSRGC